MKILFTTLLSIFMIVGTTSSSHAQLFKKKKKEETTKSPEKPKSSLKSIKSVTKNCEKFDGLFPIYRDTNTGKIYIEISKEKLGEEFIYFSYVENGLMDVGAFKGSYRGSKIFKINKSYGNIEFQLENTNYYFDPNNEISKSAETNINKPIIISEKILGKTGENFLIEASSLFMKENFAKIKPKYPPGYKGAKLGMLSKTKTKVLKIKNYPNNTDVRTRYVFDNGSGYSREMTSNQSVSITYHHSILEMPKNDFKPRKDDPRLGYFMTQVTDQTSASVTPYRDMIHRWNLVKKDPEADLSEPVEPITWWIENTTPKELRPIIKEGVEKWNIAFEKAGFKNAVVVKIQPDTADWDAGDIRYNVLRWTSTPKPPFGGYGPSFVNPRTGEILGADIMLEYVYILGRIRSAELFEKAGLEFFDTEKNAFEHDHTYCSIGAMMQEDVFFGNTAMSLTDLTGIEKDKFLRESIQRLVLHEVGHTLGLNHNMKGSSIQTMEDLKNQEKMDKEGMCNSVMEYPSINFALNKEDQTYYYDDKPGLYDHWVIEYGYSTALEDEEAEQKRLDNILSRSTDPKLVFGNDADDMRSPGKGIDPLVNIYDLSSDPVGYAKERIELIDTKLMPLLMKKYSKDNQSYMELRNAYLSLNGQKAIQLNIMTRQIGGVYVNRAFVGQSTTTAPLTPVPYEVQKAAMEALTKHAFAPEVFEVDQTLIQHLQQQRRGFNHRGSGEDPKILDRNLAVQSGLFAHLLHPNVLKRISNTELYGNTYTLPEYLADLTDAVFKEDRFKKVSSARQNLQILYTKSLIAYLGNKNALYNTKSQVLGQLNQILIISKERASDSATKAHKMHLKLLIEKALEAK